MLRVVYRMFPVPFSCRVLKNDRKKRKTIPNEMLAYFVGCLYAHSSGTLGNIYGNDLNAFHTSQRVALVLVMHCTALDRGTMHIPSQPIPMQATTSFQCAHML